MITGIDQAFFYSRVIILMWLIALLVYSAYRPPSTIRPFIISVLVYFSITLINSSIKNLVNKEYSDFVIAFAGSPLLLFVFAGLFESHRRGKR